ARGWRGAVGGGGAGDSGGGGGGGRETDAPPLRAPVTKRAWTEHQASAVGAAVDEAFRLATAPHRGPVFLDVAIEALFGDAGAGPPTTSAGAGPPATAPGTARAGTAAGPDPADVEAIAGLIPDSSRPVLLLRSQVCLGAPSYPAPPGARSWGWGRRWGAAGQTRPRGRQPANCASQWSPTARAAGYCPPATNCSSPGRARWRSGRLTWCWWWGRRWTSGSATGPSAGGAAATRHRVSMWQTGPITSPPTSRWPPRPPETWPGSSPPGPAPFPRRRGGPPPGNRPGRARGSPGSPPRPARPSPPTRRCWPATPTPSTRCACTASSPACSMTMRW